MADDLPERTPPTLLDLGDRIDDLEIALARQSGMLGRLVDDAAERSRSERSGGDVPLLLDLFVLRSTVRTLAETARSKRERAAFDTVVERLGILLTARGGEIVAPRFEDRFDPASMEAAEVVDTAEPALDHTIAAVAREGLRVGARLVRPARVVVRRLAAD